MVVGVVMTGRLCVAHVTVCGDKVMFSGRCIGSFV
jgi:hypothetical protein